MNRAWTCNGGLSSMACALALLAGTPCAMAQFSKFTVIDSGPFQSVIVRGLSADGTTLVGDGSPSLFSDGRAFRRRFDGPTENLGVLSGSFFTSAEAANGTGSMVVGRQSGGGFVWVFPGPGAADGTDGLLDVSRDGAVTISRIARRTGGTSLGLPVPSGFTEVSAARLAGDATTLVAYTARQFVPGNGYGYPPTPDVDFTRAGRWDAGSGVQVNIGVLSGGASSRALGISADGQVVVGVSDQVSAGEGVVQRGFKWSAATGILGLGVVGPGTTGTSEARDVSADGRVIVGVSNGKAVVWENGGAARSIAEVLMGNGQDLQGWSLLSALAVSDDGQVVTGVATREGSASITVWAASLTFTCTPPALAGQATFTPVAIQGFAPAGGAGALFGNGIFGLDVSRFGTVLFSGPRSDGSESVFVDGLQSDPVLVATAGAGAPVPVGSRVTPDGRVAVTDRGPSGAERYRLGVPGGLETIAAAGSVLPGTGGGVFMPQSNVQDAFLVNDESGVASLQAVYEVSAETSFVSMFVFGGGVLQRVNIDLLGEAASVLNPRHFGNTATGATAIRGELNVGNRPALLIGGPPPARMRLVAFVGQGVPGQAADVVFTNIHEASVAGSHVDFIGTFTVVGTPRRGVFRADSSGVSALVVDGEVLPGVGTVQSVLSGPTRLAAVSETETVFTASVLSGGVTRVMLLRRTPSGVSRLMAVGDALPGAVCREVTGIDLVAAEAGRYLVEVSTGSFGGKALYVITSQGVVRVVEPGQTVTIAPLGDVTVTTVGSVPLSVAGGTSAGGGASGLRDRFVVVNATVNDQGVTRRVILRAELPGVSVTRCSPADIADDQGEALPPNGNGGIAPSVNNGVTEGDYNLFFAQFFDAGAACDIADDTGQALPPFGVGGVPPFVNNGVTEGDYNLFFSVFFDGCPA